MSPAHRPGNDRDRYADVGAATREAWEVALACGADAMQLRVLGALTILLASRSRTWDWIGTRVIAAHVYSVDYEAVTGWQRWRVAVALRELEAMGSVVHDPGGGRGRRSRVTFGKGPGSDALFSHAEDVEKGAGIANEKGAGIANERAHTGWATTRSTNEDVDEETNCAAEVSAPRDDGPAVAEQLPGVAVAPSANGRARARVRDPLFDAVTAALGMDQAQLTRSARGALNRALADLRAVAADPLEVPARVAMHRATWDVRVTPTSLAKHWPELVPDPRQLPGNDGAIARAVDRIEQDRRR